jgi:CRISPR-associated protein Cas2
MSEPLRRLLVAYDVSSDTRRDRVAVALQSYGQRVQYSVFLVDGKPADFVRLQLTLRKLIDLSTDRILLCDLGTINRARNTSIFIGRQTQLTGDQPSLIL